MNKVIRISWSLHDFCQSKCSYCPTRYWGGNIPHNIIKYLEVTEKIIDHYANLGYHIQWYFDGGEPLEMHDLPQMLKLCKTKGTWIQLHTNGGRLWLDWWAIEPNIDHLVLSYHYWQNPKLIEYILDTFKKNSKSFELIVPIRPDYFDDDLSRALNLEKKYGIVVSKSALYKDSSQVIGLYDYTDTQLRIMSGQELVDESINYKETTFEERQIELVESSPVYTGKFCNAGMERLYISHQGWVNGSHCRNDPLGNIFDSNWNPPVGPTICKMQACQNSDDQTITKFP